MDGVLLETDLIVEFLLAPPGRPTVMRHLLATTTCFTTFVQAAELLAIAGDAEEHRVVDRGLIGLKILGASARYATTIGRILASLESAGDYRTAIIAAMAIESRLPIVTHRYAARYGAIEGLAVIESAPLAAAGDLLTFQELYASSNRQRSA